MFINRLQKLGERGDSIVEVLIAIGILSTVLAGAFLMTNRSLQTSRDAQERTNAVKLVETQIELIKSLAQTSPGTLFGAVGNFCVTSASAIVPTSNAACHVDVSGNAVPATTQPSFSLSVSKSGNTFTAKDTWVSVNGKTTNSVTMLYRVYQ